jgi:hypothetical protein
MYALVILGAAAFIGIYYVRYYASIKKAGGRHAAGKIYWREQFGLDPDEDVVSMGIGTWYLGPLVPETMRSTAEKVFDALSRTTYRGANMFVAFTSKHRLALAVEPTENGPRPAASSIGLARGYAPLAIFGAGSRPRIERGEEAWPGSPDLPGDRQKPNRVNTLGHAVRQELVRLTDAGGHQMTFFVEGDWVGWMQHWAQGGPPRIDPQWVEPAAPSAAQPSAL